MKDYSFSAKAGQLPSQQSYLHQTNLEQYHLVQEHIL